MWEVVNDLELGAYAQTMSLRQGQLLCGTTDGKMLSINPIDLTITSVCFVDYKSFEITMTERYYKK